MLTSIILTGIALVVFYRAEMKRINAKARMIEAEAAARSMQAQAELEHAKAIRMILTGK